MNHHTSIARRGQGSSLTVWLGPMLECRQVRRQALQRNTLCFRALLKQREVVNTLGPGNYLLHSVTVQD